MAGTVTVTREHLVYGKGKNDGGKTIEKVTIDWVGDASDGSVPNTNIDLYGFCIKAITNPGTTAPTANYDIAFGDPDDTGLDALAGALANRSASATEQVEPKISSAVLPSFLAGTYQFQLSNNSVNSATGSCILYLVDEV